MDLYIFRCQMSHRVLQFRCAVELSVCLVICPLYFDFLWMSPGMTSGPWSCKADPTPLCHYDDWHQGSWWYPACPKVAMETKRHHRAIFLSSFKFVAWHYVRAADFCWEIALFNEINPSGRFCHWWFLLTDWLNGSLPSGVVLWKLSDNQHRLWTE